MKPVEALVNQMLQGIVDLFMFFMSIWVRTPGVSLDPDDPVGSSVVATQGYFLWITAFFAVLGFIVAAARMAWMARAEPVREMLRMVLMLLFVQGAAVTATQILLRAGDEFSPWLLDQVLGVGMRDAVTQLFPFIKLADASFEVNPVGTAALGLGALLVVAIVILLSVMAQIALLILRDVMLALLLAFLPTLAAASMFKGGSEAFDKAIGWMVALLCYKPVAAGIFALGGLMVKGTTNGATDSPAQTWGGTLIGTLTLILAVVAMPALVKFIAPAAGRGASNAFSGGAALAGAAGAAATGAAVVAMVGTGGASAGATAGAGATTGAASNGAAASGGASSTTASSTGAGAPAASGGPGSSGTDGSHGSSGVTGASSTGQKGDPGASEAGAAGSSSTGAAGARGDGGDVGSGTAGAKGSDGAGGARGADGASTHGADGSQGRDGSQRALAASQLAGQAGQAMEGPAGGTVEDVSK